jgi:hypothetical protein
MNSKLEFQNKTTCVSMPATDLLETVKYLRATAGDSLDDNEFTFLVQEKNLPAEAGFRFLCFDKGCVMLAVPTQENASWHPTEGWIPPAKEKIATRLAKKYGFMLCEPPDLGTRLHLPYGMATHHHLEFCKRNETVVIAHPGFIKIRLYSLKTGLVFPPMPGFLNELAELYCPQPEAEPSARRENFPQTA